MSNVGSSRASKRTDVEDANNCTVGQTVSNPGKTPRLPALTPGIFGEIALQRPNARIVLALTVTFWPNGTPDCARAAPIFSIRR